MGLHEAGRPAGIAGLPAERLLAPLQAVATDLHDQLRTHGGHRAEQAVAVDRPERRDQPHQPVGPFGTALAVGHFVPQRQHADDGDARRRDGDRGAPRRGLAAPDARRGPQREVPGQQAHQRRVVEQCQVQHDGQQVEEAVVAGGCDSDLEKAEQREGGEAGAAEAGRGQHQERHDQLDAEHDHGGSHVQPGRKLVRVPARPGGQRLRLVVERQRGQPRPGRVAADQLGDARQERQLERQPPDEPARDPQRLPAAAEARQPAERRIEAGEQAGFQQQRVPLERQERLPGDGQRQVQQPEQGECQHRRHAGAGQQREHDARPADRQQPGVTRAQPGQGGKLVPGGGAVELAGAFEQVRGRQQPLLAHQAPELRRERGEGDQVDERQQTQEQPARQLVARGWDQLAAGWHIAPSTIITVCCAAPSCWEVVQW